MSIKLKKHFEKIFEMFLLHIRKNLQKNMEI